MRVDEPLEFVPVRHIVGTGDRMIPRSYESNRCPIRAVEMNVVDVVGCVVQVDVAVDLPLLVEDVHFSGW